MKNVIGITVALGLVASGVATVVKHRKDKRAAERQVAARNALKAKQARSAEAAADAQAERDAVKAKALREENERLANTPEVLAGNALECAARWVGLHYNFLDETLRNDAFHYAEQNGFTLVSEGFIPFLIVALRAKDLHPDWLPEQHVEAGKIAAAAMKILGDDYHQSVVFTVVDDVVKFEIINPANTNAVTALVTTYATKLAQARDKYAA